MFQAFRATALLLLMGLGLHGQTPDCLKSFQFTATGQTSTTFDNRQAGCNAWFVVYQSSGFSAISLTLQDAPGAVSAGTFVTFGGTTVTGANPSTNIVGNTSTFTGYYGFMRVILTSSTGTGTVTGVMFGYKQTPGNVTATISGSVNSVITNTPLPVSNPTPSLFTSLPATSSTTTTPGPSAGLTMHCDYSAGIAGGAAASTVIVAGVASNRIYVCGFSFTSGGVGTVVIAEATTGTACATAVANRTGIYPVIAGTPVNFTPGDAFAMNTVTAGKDLCVITTGTATAQGILSFMVRP